MDNIIRQRSHNIRNLTPSQTPDTESQTSSVNPSQSNRSDLHSARLVNVVQQPLDTKVVRKVNNIIYHGAKEGSNVPADEGVGSPTNIDYDDEEELADEYYDEEEESSVSDQTDELTNLSRQSMMPLHELIAYYQYIQQGNLPIDANQSVSRQSSVTIKQSSDAANKDTTDGQLTNRDVISIEEESKGLILANEPSIEKKSIPTVTVENVDIEKDSQQLSEEASMLPVQPIKDRRRIRTNVILELINSERDFVKHLRDVVEGYLYPARRHPEIFTGDRINIIFANIEQLYEFQRKFLESLETCINWDDLAQSEVGQCFLDYESGFSVYHYYCNNHPNATSELQELYTKPRFVKFFEACRLLQNMIDISLDGFLLTPIQKICKYPLQLNELLKNTDEDHPDHQPVTDALESMRKCANLANERKRRIEALADIMSFQEKVENWFGPKLCDTSSILIHSGEVSKMNSHNWSQGVQLYLFNHLLLYCKKDLLKRNILILKGRINFDFVTEISDADEFKPRKSFKLFCSEQKKWFVFATRSEKEKDEWIKAFERERDLVDADENEGFYITEKEIGVARRALHNRKHSRSARYRHKRPDTAIVDQLDIDDAHSIMNRTLSLPSCVHPRYVMNFVEDSRVVNDKSPSPVSSNQQLCEQPRESGGGSWFRKMGSKKLSKSQVYNVNGPGSLSAKSPKTISPSGDVKYDQLEKRHRDHMVSEEQARLFRLNNDHPPPMFQHQNLHIPQARQTRSASDASPSQRPEPREPPVSRRQENSSLVETTVVLSSGRIVRVIEDEV